MIPCPVCLERSVIGLKQRGKTKYDPDGRYRRVYRCGDCGIEQRMMGGPGMVLPTYEVTAPSDKPLH